MSREGIGVVDALARRLARGGRPPFDDDCRIALVSEGGAMRGVIAGGMVSAIEAAGMTGCFDLMIGSSAGACALAYLRAGQARFGTRIFYEDINNRHFIDHRRPLKGKPIVDIDFLVDRVFSEIKRLDCRAIGGPGAALYATVTDVGAASTDLLGGFTDRPRAMEILRATTRMPFLAAGPVGIDGRRYLDGSVLCHLPVALARAQGATHILVIMTKPPGDVLGGKRARQDRVVLPTLLGMRYGRPLARAAIAEARTYREQYRLLGSGAEVAIDGAHVLGVTPGDGPAQISRTETDAALLREGARLAEARMAAALGV